MKQTAGSSGGARRAKSVPPTATEALGMLLSALGYLEDAGVTVSIVGDGPPLALEVEGVKVVEEGERFGFQVVAQGDGGK